MEHKKIDLTINPEAVRQILTGFIHSEISRSGFTRAVVNLSGGLDSTLSCYLAAEAMGAENVLALRLPYKSSAPQFVGSCPNGDRSTGGAIPDHSHYRHGRCVDRTFPRDEPGRQGNIMARLRMIVLYDQTEVFHGLAVGTGNKTEILLGYTTLYGDSACAINPSGRLV